jgi:hypothetical protein
MKKIILAIVLAFVSVSLVHAEAETKKVCEKTKDDKGKGKEVCKQVKIHKKLDGEKLPEKK